MTARPLAELVDPGWADALGPVADQVTKMGEFLREENSSGRGYLPSGANVLRAFTYPLADVRVLIVGQDPYPTPGHAMGLSFSVAAMYGRCRAAWATSSTSTRVILAYPSRPMEI